MRPKTTFKAGEVQKVNHFHRLVDSPGLKEPTQGGFSVISTEKKSQEPAKVLAFYKELSKLKEVTHRLSFMISEIHHVLESTPNLRQSG